MTDKLSNQNLTSNILSQIPLCKISCSKNIVIGLIRNFFIFTIIIIIIIIIITIIIIIITFIFIIISNDIESVFSSWGSFSRCFCYVFVKFRVQYTFDQINIVLKRYINSLDMIIVVFAHKIHTCTVIFTNYRKLWIERNVCISFTHRSSSWFWRANPIMIFDSTMTLTLCFDWCV